MGKYVVIGLGRFGATVAEELARLGQEVIAIDDDIAHVEAIKDQVALAVRMDATDEQALVAQGVRGADCAVIGMGSGFEANALATMLCRRIGIGRIVSRTVGQMQERILSLIGADEVINPERECGRRLAHRLVNPLGLEHHAIAEGYSFAQMEAPPTLVGRQLRDLDLRKRYEVNIVAIRRRVREAGSDSPETRIVMPDSGTIVEEGDVLVLIGADAGIARLLTG